MSSYTISNSDEEILNALTIADGMRKEFASNSIFATSSSVSYESGDSERTTSTTSSTNDSSPFKGIFNQMNEICDSFKFDAEFQTVSQDVQTVYLMNDLFIERKSALEIETKTCIDKEISLAQEVLSNSILNKRLESINLVVKHLLSITNQMGRIKQALQDEPFKSTIKVPPSCQEGVVQFFHTVDAIIKKMLNFAGEVDFSDKNFTKVIPINEMALHTKLQSIITGLVRRLDILTEFRNRLSTEELEISESGKLETPKSIFDQI